MADPISIIGLVGQAGDLLIRLYDYVQTVRSAKKEVYELYTEILALKGILEQIDQRQQAAQGVDAATPALQWSQQYKDTLVATKALLHSMLEDLTARKESKLASLTWARQKSSAQEQTTKVERAKSFFVLVLMNDASVSQQDVVALVKDISTSLAIDRREKEEREQEKLYDQIRAWLAPANPESFHAKARERQQLGTGSWFLNGPFSMWLNGRDDRFRDWCAQEREAAKRLKNAPMPDYENQSRHPMDDDARFLFLAGPSGCGKTVLFAAAIEMAKQAVATDTNLGTAYYYFSASYPASQSSNAMLGSVLAQLCKRNDSVLAILRTECDRGDVLDDKQLVLHIAQCCNAMSESYIFIDAINESQSAKIVLLSLYRILSQAKSVRIFVTSTASMIRLSPYIKEVQANVYLRSEHTNDDVRAYAIQRLEVDEPTCFLSSARKEELATSLVAQAEGIFRYAACQLDSYSRMHTGREVIRAIDKMPEDLFKVYADSLSQVPSQDRDMVREALVWVVHATQPLTLGALAEAVVLELEDTYMDAELRLSNPREILTMCRGILDHDHETAQVFLSHATIRDFLFSAPGDDVDAWYRFNTGPIDENNRRIFDKCMAYLMFDDFASVCADMAELNTRRERYPLIDYAAQAWPDHYPGDDAALGSVLRLFESRTKDGGNYATWVQILIKDAPPKVALLTDPLYYAASFGLLHVVQHLVQTGSAIDLPGGRALATPLQVAVFRDHLRVVRFLLKNGADPNSKNVDGVTNMECALLRKNAQAQRLLKDHGATEPENSKAPDPMGREYDRWAKCCQCGGDFAWGTILYGACNMFRISESRTVVPLDERALPDVEARQAQETFWYERADTRKDFLGGVQWQSLREGLLVGEQIDLALRSMEHEYMDLNCRDYEITKSFSLRLHFPLAFFLLKTTGYCELELPEWMFDLDYPGHYLRRIRNIAVSVPVVAGPYTGIHCRMQLLSSRIRYKSLLREPKIACCDKKVEDCHCDEDDTNVITRYSGTEAIATSDGLDDDGLIELNFRDELYLPFEFSGAVSRWRIELPPANNEFDFNSLSDFIIKLNYTAREGGDQLRRKASECAQKHLPSNGVRYFDIRHEFQDSWGVFQRPACDFTPHEHRDFEVRLSRNMFPFLTGCRKLLVKCMHLFIEKDCYDAEELCKRQGGDHIRASFIPHWAGRGRHDGNRAVAGGSPREFVLRNSSDCLELYHDHFDLDLAPIVGYVPELLGKLRLPSGLEDVKGAYLLCEYITKETTGSCGKVLEAMSREGSSWH